MFDKRRLQDVLVAYKEDFALTWWENEKYKWEAIKVFQENWHIDAKDFADMLDRALSGTKNLLASNHYFPCAMIRELAEEAPEEVRGMFNELYNENLDVVERILGFKKKSDELLAKYGAGRENHFQDERAISNYLWLRYPDKYYIYKLSELQKASKVLYADYKLKKGKHADNLRCFYALYDEVCVEIQKDEELKQLLKAHLTDDCYPDPQYRTLTMDVCYYIATRHIPDKPQIWKISHGTDATGIKKSLRDKFAERKVVVVHGTTKAVATTKTSQGDYFKTHIKDGDFFYLCYGNSIQLLGQFIGDDAVLNEEMPDKWYERKYKVRAVSKETSAYDGEQKWWTPNYNSTCVPINKGEQGLFEKLILKPYFDMTIDELIHTDPPQQRYWWLNANPKIWSYSGLAIDETEAYTLFNENGNKRRIFQNFLDARAGDMVIGYEATPVKQIVAICQIVAEQDGKEIKFKKVEHLTSPIDYAQLKVCPELSKFDFFSNPNGSLFSLRREEYDFIIDLIREENPLRKNEGIEKYTKQSFLAEVFMDERKYDKLVAVLRNKKNIILQGAPGVGKTFAARRLAHSLMGEKDDSRIEFVQFHQNYSYEDFMMGYKPSENGFEMRKGVFNKFCIKASNQPDKDFFFIIDEINRGNMSKIFGELLMMIENDYRGEYITLAYDEIPFAVPKNLYIIGMMNTADRSLAMIDYALRRRFSFIEMMPAFDTKGFKDYQKGLGNEMFNQLIEKVKELNETITNDNSLGKGFCIGHSYFSNWEKAECTQEKMLSVVEFDIVPMLEEYWFDDNSKVQQWSDELLKVLE